MLTPARPAFATPSGGTPLGSGHSLYPRAIRLEHNGAANDTVVAGLVTSPSGCPESGGAFATGSRLLRFRAIGLNLSESRATVLGLLPVASFYVPRLGGPSCSVARSVASWETMGRSSMGRVISFIN